MVRVSVISTDAFSTLGIPVLMGRDFTDQEIAEDTPTVIINQAFADQNWPNENPLGRRISFEEADGPFLEVVGVVKTVKYDTIGEAPTPTVYRPLPHMFSNSIMLLARTSGEPMHMAPAVRQVIRDIDPNFSPSDTRPYTEVIGFALLPAKFGAALFSLFGVLALLLATVGLYGVMSYMVTQRTHEIGIRMAIGAGKRDVLRLILRQGFTLTLIGLAIGLAGAFGATRVLATLLYDVSPTDPLTFAAISLLLLIVALAAMIIPARRAMNVDPLVALRYE
jgi:putative ABC transport system permease protein